MGEQTDKARQGTNHHGMLESVITNLERTENLKRQDSEVTTSTVETFVSERPVFTLNVPESGKKKTEVGDVERNAEELLPSKGWCFHFYHKHTGTIAILVFISFVVIGLTFLILGSIPQLGFVGFAIAGGFVLMVPLVMLIMKFVAFLASAEQREAALPYVGLNSRYFYENSAPNSDFRNRVSSAW